MTNQLRGVLDMPLRINKICLLEMESDLNRERVSEDFPLPVLPTIPTWWLLVAPCDKKFSHLFSSCNFQTYVLQDEVEALPIPC